MRKSTKKFLSVAMILALTASLTACGSKTETSTNTTDPTKAPATSESTSKNETSTSGSEASTAETVEKPASITVMCDGTVFTEVNKRDELEKALEEKLGIDIIFNQPEHSGYYDVVGTTFASGEWPDVVLLGAAYYATYASAGALADITDYWNNSELKASGRFVNTAAIDALAIDGKIYGFSPARGNGCVTYIKQSWLDKVGLKAPTNYAEYVEVLKAFTENDMDGSGDPSNTYAVSAAGLVGTEAPYVNYLPEFYQDAYPDFYQKDGVWVDGFSEAAMEGALTRLQEAYTNGWLDKETLTNGTKDCRNKFYDDKFGIFTYWAGTWATNLKNNLVSNGLDDDLVVLQPLAEVGSYVERQAPVWCITSKAQNPEGIFKYFIETMLDGGEIQTLWTYGVEGVHWSTAAETITYGENTATYEAGQFHMLPSPEKPDTLLTKHHIDPMLSLATFVNGDPGAANIEEAARDCSEKFNEWSTMAPVIVSNETMQEYNADLWDARNHVITQVVTQGMSVADGMAYYHEKTDSMVADILASLNQ